MCGGTEMNLLTELFIIQCIVSAGVPSLVCGLIYGQTDALFIGVSLLSFSTLLISDWLKRVENYTKEAKCVDEI